jgi:hypothetical protein
MRARWTIHKPQAVTRAISFDGLNQKIFTNWCDQIHQPTKLRECLPLFDISKYNTTNTDEINFIKEMLTLFDVNYPTIYLTFFYVNYLWRYEFSKWTSSVFALIMTT